MQFNSHKKRENSNYHFNCDVNGKIIMKIISKSPTKNICQRFSSILRVITIFFWSVVLFINRFFCFFLGLNGCKIIISFWCCLKQKFDCVRHLNITTIDFIGWIQSVDMDLTSIFLFCLISLVIGAVLMILVQYYVFVKYFNEPDNDSNTPQRNRSLNERYQLPDVSSFYIHFLFSTFSLFERVYHFTMKYQFWEFQWLSSISN